MGDTGPSRGRYTHRDYVTALSGLYTAARSPEPADIAAWIKERKRRAVAPTTIAEWVRTDPAIPRRDVPFLFVVEYLLSCTGKAWSEAIEQRWTDRRADAYAEARRTGSAKKSAPAGPAEPAPAAAAAGGRLAEWVEHRGVDGGLPLVGELDAYAVGASGSRFGGPNCDPGAEDPYVPRTRNSVDAWLTAGLDSGRLVVVVGPSKVGKTRSLFHVVSAALPDARLVAPVVGALAEIAACGDYIGSGEIMLVWLDDLDRFLVTGQPLTPALLAAMTARAARTVVVATLRSEARHRLRADTGELGRDIHRLFDQAITVELEPTSADPDEQAAAAAAYPDVELHGYGLGEVLSGGPALLARYHDHRAAHDVSSAAQYTVVQVAIDWARIGQTTPLAEQRLAQLAHAIAEDAYPALDIGADDIDGAIETARTPPPGIGRAAALTTTRLPDRSRGYRAFDYLVAADDDPAHPRPIPDGFWARAAADLDAGALYVAGLNAFYRGLVPQALALLSDAGIRGDIGAMFGVGAVLKARGELRDAEPWFLGAAQRGHLLAMNSLAVSYAQQGLLAKAEPWWRTAAEHGNTDAMLNLSTLLVQQQDIDGAEQWAKRHLDAKYGPGSTASEHEDR